VNKGKYMTDEEYTILKKKIHKTTGINLDYYKPNQMRRRLDSFISNAGFSDAVSYWDHLEHDQEMIRKLRDFLTINVSEFFRDFKYFEILKNEILPVLLNKYGRLNIWSAGCSNGAESFSIAIMLDQLSPNMKHRIMGTDIDNHSLTKAMNGGPYRPEEIKNVSAEILSKYFINTSEGYKTAEPIRQSILFKQHDMLQDEFEKGFNLIICRNVVIYFSVEAKNKLYNKFYESLKNDGVLFIGGTEAMLDASTYGFQMLRTCFYRKTNNVKAAGNLVVSAH